MSGTNPTALIAAAPTLFRHGLLAMFQQQWPRVAIMLLADTAPLPELVAAHPFTLLVLDSALAGSALPNLLAHLQQARPAQPLLLLADPYAPFNLSDSALASPDASLMLPYQTPPHALVAAITPWLDKPAAPLRPTINTDGNTTSKFSLRELEVLDLVAADYCNDEIADRLCLSVRTVESHRRALLQKAGTRTLVGLATRAVREGWIRA